MMKKNIAIIFLFASAFHLNAFGVTDSTTLSTPTINPLVYCCSVDAWSVGDLTYSYAAGGAGGGFAACPANFVVAGTASQWSGGNFDIGCMPIHCQWQISCP